MPKVVDHAQRRAQIARAMWRVVARDGMAAASARTIAAESGWSLGAVRHYFSSQDELYRFAAEEMVATVSGRISAAMDAGRPGIHRCAVVLEQLLPLDEQRCGEVRTWLALIVQAQSNLALDGIRHLGFESERRVCRYVVAELARRPGVDITESLPVPLEREAADLQVVLDGLTLQATMTPERVTPTVVRRALRSYLTSLAARVRERP